MQTEIQNKEKVLAELMTRILQAPLDPIEKSIKKMQSDLLDTQDQLQNINDLVAPSLNALMEDLDKSSKYSRSALTKIHTDIPALNSDLKEHMSMVSEDQRQALDSMISEHTTQSNVFLKSNSDELLNAISRTSNTQSETLISVSSVRQELIIAIEGAKAAQALAMQAALKEIQSSLQLSEENRTADTTKLESITKIFSAKLDTLSTEIQDVIAEQRLGTNELSEFVQKDHAATNHLMTQQHAVLQAQALSFQRNLKIHATITIVFFASMLVYIAFDIAHKFN